MNILYINGGIADQPGTPILDAGPACPVGFFEATIEERNRVVDGGGISIVVIDGAIVERATTGTFATDYVPQIEKKVYLQDFDVSVNISVTDSAMIIEDGVAKSLQNGATRNLILATPQVSRSFSVTPKVENVTTPIETFSHWSAGTLARFNVDRSSQLIDGKTDSAATRKLFVDATRERNSECFGAAYAQDLTSVASATSRYGNHIGLTAITKRHVVGCWHTRYSAGDTVTFTDISGNQVDRTIIARLFLNQQGVDIGVYLLDEDLPVSIRPALLLPEDIGFYNPYFSHPAGSFPGLSYRVPVLFPDRNQKLNIGDLLHLSATSELRPYQSGSSGTNVPWFDTPLSGTSGKPAFLMVSQSRLALAFTFTSAVTGPSYHSRDWETIIEELDDIGGVSTGYAPERADLTEFDYFGFDSDAANYFARVEAADGQKLERAVKDAQNRVFTRLKALPATKGGNSLDALQDARMGGARTFAGSLEPLLESMPDLFSIIGFSDSSYSRTQGWIGNGDGDSGNAFISSIAENDFDVDDTAIIVHTTRWPGVLMNALAGTATRCQIFPSLTTFQSQIWSAGGDTLAVNPTAGVVGTFVTSRASTTQYTFTIPTGASTTFTRTATVTPDARRFAVFGRAWGAGSITNRIDADILFYGFSRAVDGPAIRGILTDYQIELAAALEP